jgi:hypothetical protein
MRKQFLLTSVAVVGLTAAAPALAQEGESGISASINYANNVEASVVTDVAYTKNVELNGGVTLTGDIDVDSSAVAVVDSKQILIGNSVTFREENSTDGASGNVDPAIFGAADVLPTGQGDPADAGDATIDIGFFSPIINNTAGFTVNGAGNIGVNAATGYYNMQANVAALASATYDGNDADEDDSAGWSEASATVLQAAAFNFYGPDDEQSDPTGEDTVGNDVRVRNTVGAMTVNGTGNVGVNAAAGAFNVQQNTLSVAVATDAALAEANAAVIQTADLNVTVEKDAVNTIQGGTFGGGGAGNYGVNLAAGVGNMQANTLVVAASLAVADPTTPPGPPSPGGGGFEE